MFGIAVLASGGGTDLQSIIDAVNAGTLSVQINLVVADRKAYALDRAAKEGIPSRLIPRKDPSDPSIDLSTRIEEALSEVGNIDLIVLAGFLSILTPEFTQRWARKIINVHPALLPDFGGKGMWGEHVHQAVLASGEKESGCTVHYVDAGVDTGETILQKRVPVLEGDTPATLAERVLKEEHKALPEAIGLLAKG